MRRALELALNGAGQVSPNPLVGCVVVHEGEIIGEGWHQKYGGPHAEINAIASVRDTSLLQKATLYVSLEPCAHWGKTPPCALKILELGIPRVVIGCGDSYGEVDGKGIQLLREGGVEVSVGVLEEECRWLNRRFFTYHDQKRPYIILKWAQTADGFIARTDYSSKWISNPYSRLLVHHWRGEEDAILVGTNTALHDDPQLTSREMHLKNPLRIVLDRSGRLPQSHRVFSEEAPTWVFTESAHTQFDTPAERKIIQFDVDLANTILKELWQNGKNSLIVEGGAQMLKLFLDAGLWDEARIFSSPTLFDSGIAAPRISGCGMEEERIAGDLLQTFYREGKGLPLSK